MATKQTDLSYYRDVGTTKDPNKQSTVYKNFQNTHVHVEHTIMLLNQSEKDPFKRSHATVNDKAK